MDEGSVYWNMFEREDDGGGGGGGGGDGGGGEVVEGGIKID